MASPFEFTTRTPEVFQRSDLDSLVYAETRRNPSTTDALSGNISDSPDILSDENRMRTGTGLAYEEWRALQLLKITRRLTHLKEILEIDDIIATDEISTSTKSGAALSHAGNDNAAVNIVFPGAERIAQINVGIREAARESIPRAFQQLEELGHDPRDASVYVASHAHLFQMNTAEFDEVNEHIAAGSDDLKREYRLHTSIGQTGYPVLDLSRLVFHQLERSGVLPGEIQMSDENTISSKFLFSGYATVTQNEPNGQTGVLLGKSRSSRL
mgnify:CR=1 FL=1